METKKYNFISDRLNTIDGLLSTSHIDAIVDFKNTEEEDILNKYFKSDDIRELMPKKFLDFNTAINKLGGKLLYIKSGSTGHTFKGVYPPEEKTKQPYAVKIVAYPKKENYGDMYNVKRPENAELLMIKLLSQFVIKKQTPHIVLPMTTFNTSLKPFLGLSKNDFINNKRYDQFLKRCEKGEYYQNVSVLISEWANAGDLLDYIRNNYKTFKIKHWRTIFFQFLSVLAIIQAKYPGFRHNDLKANNLLVNEISISSTDNKYCYKINKQMYNVPNIGFQIKLWDFDFACIPGIVDNAKVDAEWTDRINIKPEQNRYYDVHYFFNTLTKKGFFHEFWTEPEIPEKVREFVNRIVPDKYKEGDLVSEKGRILVNDEYLIPDEIIKNDPFFKVWRVNSC
jgi:serine/threonine protein kinase